MSYNSEHGDIFLYGDETRQQLGYNVHGVNFSTQPNSWYISAGNLPIQQGNVVIVEHSSSLIQIADAYNITSVIGVALNSAASIPSVSKTGLSVANIKNPYLIICTSTTGITAGMFIQGIGIPVNTKVVAVVNDTSIEISNAVDFATFNASGKAQAGLGVEVVSIGNFIFPDNVFAVTDIGHAVYIAPDEALNYEHVGTQGAHPQLTSNRSDAIMSDQPVIEIGIVTSISSLQVGIGGDIRGNPGITQVLALAGETIYNTAVPLVASLGSDGKVYISDKRKSMNDRFPALTILSNTTGAPISEFTQPMTTVITFTVLEGSTGSTTLTWGNGHTGNVTITGAQDTVGVATAIAAAVPSGWVARSTGSVVYMMYTGTTTIPSLTVADGVIISSMIDTEGNTQQTQLTVLGSSTGNGTILLSLSSIGISITGVKNATEIADAITLAFIDNESYNVTNIAGVITFTLSANPNRNNPAGILIGARRGYSSAATQTISDDISATSAFTKVVFSPKLGQYVAIGSDTNQTFYSHDGINWIGVAISSPPVKRAYTDIIWSTYYNKYYAVSASSLVISSTDGISWTETIVTGNWASIAGDGSGKIIIMDVNSKTSMSTNGTSWSASSGTASTAIWNSMVWSTEVNKFIAVASGSGSSTNLAYYSGSSWKQVAAATSGLPETGVISLTYSKNKHTFAALTWEAGTTATTTIYTSTDGLFWTERIIESAVWRQLTYSEERSEFIALADTVSGVPLIYTSYNCMLWSPLFFEIAFESGVYSFSSMVWSAFFNQYVVINNGTTKNSIAIYPTGIITIDTPCMVQKIGTLSNIAWTGLTAGQQIFLDTEGKFTTNPQSINFYADTMAPLGYANTTSNIYVSISPVNQKQYDIPIGTLIAFPPSTVPDYGWLLCDGSEVAQATYPDLYSVIGDTYGTPVDPDNFILPPVSSPSLQIKYMNWYSYNPLTAPMFRFDTGWTSWGDLPSDCTAIGVTLPTVAFEIPTTSFGNNPQLSDFFAEVFIKNVDGTKQYRIDPNPVVYSYIDGTTTYKRYGYQLQQDISNAIRINFATDGLAYYSPVSGTALGTDYIAVDTTWTFRVLVYQTNQYNKYVDYFAEKKLQQLWNLGLIDLDIGYTVQGAGHFDRGTSNPSHTTRLNYDGNLHASNMHVTGSYNSTVATGTAPLIVASTTLVTNLNADLLDGKHVGTSGNTVPLLDGTNNASGVNTFSNNTTSTTSATGALIVTGGVGIGENLNVAGSVDLGSDTADSVSINGTIDTDLVFTDADRTVKLGGNAGSTSDRTLTLTNAGAGKANLTVENTISSNTLTSTVASGTAPLTVTSPTLVTNLNADKADGYHFNQDVQTTASPSFVDVNISSLNRNFATYGTDTRLATGVPASERGKFKVSVVYSAPNVVATISFVGANTSFSYYINGKKFTVTATELAAYTASATSSSGTWFFYINQSTTSVAAPVMVLSKTAWTTIDPDVTLWDFYVNPVNNIEWIGEERHTAGTDIYLHARNHAQGAVYKNGFLSSSYNGLTAATLISNNDDNTGRAQVLITNGSFYDEDILNSITHTDASINASLTSPASDWNLNVNQFLGFTAIAAASTSTTQIVFPSSRTLITGQSVTVMAGNTTTIRGKVTITTGATGTTFATSTLAGMQAGDALVIGARIPIYYISAIVVGLPVWTKLASSDFLGVDISTSLAFTSADLALHAAAYNNAVAGTLATMTAGRYYPIYLMATNSTFEPIIAILGQGQSTNSTLATALGEAPFQFANLLGLSGLGIQEIVPFGRLTFIYNTAGGYTNCRLKLRDITFLDTRVSTVSGTIIGSAPSSIAASMVLTDTTAFGSWLTITDTTAQSAFDSIDNASAVLETAVGVLDDFRAWDLTRTYASNDPAFYLGVPYRSLQNTNLNNQPDTSGAYWKVTGGGAMGGGNNAVFYENDITVTTNYTITSNKNALTAGPITINAGVTIGVPSGSVWTIV